MNLHQLPDFQFIFDHSPEGILVLDPSGHVIDANPSAARLLNRPLSMLISLNWDAEYPHALDDSCISVNLPVEAKYVLDIQRFTLPDNRQVLFLREISSPPVNLSALSGQTRTLDQVADNSTANLQATIQSLENEVQERLRVESDLRRIQDTLVQRLAELNRQLTALYELILMSGQTRQEQDLMLESLDMIRSALNAKAACLHTYHTDSGIMEQLAHQNMTIEIQTATMFLPQGWVERSPVVWACENLADDPRASLSLRYSGFGAAMMKWISLPEGRDGVISLYWEQAKVFDVQEIALFGAMADQFEFVIDNFRLRQQYEQAAALQERRRLARDLHDSVTQSLHSLALAADTALVRWKNGRTERLEWSLNHLSESARQAVKEMRLLLFELSLDPMDEIDLVEALQTRLQSVEQRAGINVEFHANGLLDFPAEQEREIYHITTEALNNSLKHARATQVKLNLASDPTQMVMTLEDNGVGFNLQEIGEQGHARGGLGLKSMRERAERLGGELWIDSAPGQGTRINLLIHLNTL